MQTMYLLSSSMVHFTELSNPIPHGRLVTSRIASKGLASNGGSRSAREYSECEEAIACYGDWYNCPCTWYTNISDSGSLFGCLHIPVSPFTPSSSSCVFLSAGPVALETRPATLTLNVSERQAVLSVPIQSCRSGE